MLYGRQDFILQFGDDMSIVWTTVEEGRIGNIHTHIPRRLSVITPKKSSS